MLPLRLLLAVGLVLFAGSAAQPQSEPNATAIRAVYRNGQTFVTWMDAGAGEAGARYRYALYRADVPITEGNLGDARLGVPALGGGRSLSCRPEAGGDWLP